MRSCPEKRPGWSSRGAALIEFALVLPFLIVITLMAVDMSRAFWTKNVLHQAAREGVRMRIVLGSPLSSSDEDAVVARAQQVAGAAVDSAATRVKVEVAGPDGSRLDYVTVTADFKWLPMVPAVCRAFGITITNPMPLSATCYMKQEG